MRYYRNDTALIVPDLGDVFFRLFAVLNKFGLDLNEIPFDIEGMKANTASLDQTYIIGEEALLQNYIFELGVLSNIYTDNIKYGVEELTEADLNRIKTSIYSYILQLLIMVCKCKLSIEKVLELNLNRMKAKARDRKARVRVPVHEDDEPVDLKG
jgi:hypothetical protein